MINSRQYRQYNNDKTVKTSVVVVDEDDNYARLRRQRASFTNIHFLILALVQGHIVFLKFVARSWTSLSKRMPQ